MRKSTLSFILFLNKISGLHFCYASMPNNKIAQRTLGTSIQIMTTYAKNYLTNVIMRVDFGAIPSIASDNAPAMSNSLSSFPKSRAIEGREYEVRFNETGHSVNNILNRIWEYKSNDENQIVHLATNHLSLEYLNKSYKDYREAGNLFENIWNSFVQNHKPASVARIGLRYINQIDSIPGHTFDLKDWLHDDIATAITAGFRSDFRPVRSMHQLRLKKDEKTLLINYGLFNSEYPNPIARKEFVIDIDTFIGEDIQPNGVLEIMKELNSITEEFFEYMIGDKTRTAMEPHT